MTEIDEHCRYQVSWSEEDEAFVAQCVQYPDISWLAETSEQALSGIRSVVLDFIQEDDLEEL